MVSLLHVFHLLLGLQPSASYFHAHFFLLILFLPRPSLPVLAALYPNLEELGNYMGLALNSDEVQRNLALVPVADNVSVSEKLHGASVILFCAQLCQKEVKPRVFCYKIYFTVPLPTVMRPQSRQLCDPGGPHSSVTHCGPQRCVGECEACVYVHVDHAQPELVNKLHHL